jgi:hypothetical protein
LAFGDDRKKVRGELFRGTTEQDKLDSNKKPLKSRCFENLKRSSPDRTGHEKGP